MTKSLEKKLDQLPPDLLPTVEHFVDELLQKHEKSPPREFKFDWAGALSDLRDRYTSVELQHKALEWWGD